MFPKPEQALLVPDAECDAVERVGAVQVCRFGAAREGSAATVALLGDSHASHWRAAIGRAGQFANWHAVGMTRSSCPFTRARPKLEGGGDRLDCRNYNDEVVDWLTANPQINTVFVSAIATAKVRDAPTARDQLDTLVLGYQDAWEDLPPTVTRVIVLRDVPTRPNRATACIEAAIDAKRPAMPGCAVPRERRLIADPSVIAARKLNTRRVAVVDLSDFMCDDELCYPVVGGVLVNKDSNHLSREFSTTLGPYLLRRIRRVLPKLPPVAPEPPARR